MSAFRDAGAALERVAALEAENAELRQEIEKLRSSDTQERSGAARDVAQMREQIATLKRKLLKAEGRDADTAHRRLVEQRQEQIDALAAQATKLEDDIERGQRVLAEIEAARKAKQAELDAKMREVADALAALGRGRAEEERKQIEHDDNRDAVIARLHEERDELARDVQRLRQDLTKKKRR